MPNRLKRHLLLRCWPALLFADLALASDFSQAPWEFQLAPIALSGISIDGDARISDPLPLDLDFDDAGFENMDAAYIVHFEAKKGKLALFAEYQYAKLEPDVGIGPAETEIDFKNILFELGAGFTFSETQWTRWESLFGIRYAKQDIDVNGTLNFPPPPAGSGPVTSSSNSGDDWWHPFWGLRVWQRLSDRWSLIARGDFGYAASDNKSTNGSAMIDYRFNNRGSVFAGYRYIDFDYDDGNGADRYAFQAAQQGPLVGLNIYW